MNASRRKKIYSLIEKLEALAIELEEVKDEEEDAYDNLPESIQYSDRGETMEGNVNALDEALDSVQASIESLQEIE